jgi:hypothetical protein
MSWHTAHKTLCRLQAVKQSVSPWWLLEIRTGVNSKQKKERGNGPEGREKLERLKGKRWRARSRGCESGIMFSLSQTIRKEH